MASTSDNHQEATADVGQKSSKKAAPTAPITTFFRPVSEGTHKLNVLIDQRKLLNRMEMTMQKEMDVKEAARKKREDQIVEDIKRRLVASKSPHTPDDRTLEQRIRDEIQQIAPGDCDIFIPKKVKVWKGRADGWKSVAEYAIQHGDNKAMSDFPEYFTGAPYATSKMRLLRWKRDFSENKTPTRHRAPAYGEIIDLQLLEQFDIRRAAGLALDDHTLRLMLLPLLENHGLTGLLKENDGPNTFGSSWARRFYKRHNISTRVCTTKMRELPADFDAKRAEYIAVGAMLLDRY